MFKDLRSPINPDTRHFVLYIILEFFTFLFILQILPDNDYLARNMLLNSCGKMFINNKRFCLKVCKY